MSLAAGCSDAREYPLVGQVLAIDTSRSEITVRHEDIPGFMPGMTMPFKVREEEALGAVAPGDLITATLVVEESTGRLTGIRKTGSAPLPASATIPVLRPIDEGAAVPDVRLVDQRGEERKLSDWRGQVVAVTFVYTRCPLPDFCPRMDQQFSTVQRAITADPSLAGQVRLLSVSFDPDYDTPEVLRAHAERVGADPAVWSYVTGTRDDIDPFAAAFGVSIMRDDKPMQEILHNLRTAVIEPDGTLARTFGGNDWKPDELLAAIRAAHAQK